MRYMAPETEFEEERLYSPKNDMFSLGILLLEVVDKDLHEKWTDCDHGSKVYKKNLEDLRNDVMKVAHPLSPLIRDLLSYNPEDRPSAEQAETRFLAALV